MEFNYFDLVATIIILFLGLKGIINGFFKELFGLIGIIGGIFVASRVGDQVGQYLSDIIFKFENSSAISFTGFLVTLAVFWLFMVILGFAFKKLSSMSGLGPVDKLLGFIFGASKFFFIAAVIAHAAYNIKAVKATIDSNMNANSILFPILVQTGGFIMKLDPVTIAEDINATVINTTKMIESNISKSTVDLAKDVKEQIQNSMPQETEDTE
ncbi:membrane protein required for colicin V production [Epsilonproteobacteria bacterium SCGC AD-308-P11]|jgi:membrane protein required for colicin V production|nr:membrane protein required for colicin V production [Epsilonproteobacteria bacterium SCGC AD-308-P11]